MMKKLEKIVVETENYLDIIIAAPGIEVEDIEVKIDGKDLIVTIPSSLFIEGGEFIEKLPFITKEENIEVAYNNGMLSFTIKKPVINKYFLTSLQINAVQYLELADILNFIDGNAYVLDKEPVLRIIHECNIITLEKSD